MTRVRKHQKAPNTYNVILVTLSLSTLAWICVLSDSFLALAVDKHLCNGSESVLPIHDDSLLVFFGLFRSLFGVSSLHSDLLATSFEGVARRTWAIFHGKFVPLLSMVFNSASATKDSFYLILQKFVWGSCLTYFDGPWRFFRGRLCWQGSGQIFARTKTCTIPPCVHTGPVEPDEFLNGEVCKFGTWKKHVNFLIDMVPICVQTRANRARFCAVSAGNA